MAKLMENQESKREIEQTVTTVDDNTAGESTNQSKFNRKSGDWKSCDETNWYMNSRDENSENEIFLPASIRKWKYKSLCGASPRFARTSASWSSYRTAALAAEMPQEKLGAEAKEETNLLVKLRECLAKFQEHSGVPRAEYTFAALIKMMGQATGRLLLALICIIVNISPVVQILLHVLRFMLDKMISIRNTNDFRQMMMKYAIFGVQLLCIYVCLIFIFGFIVIPIFHMTVGIVTRINMFY